MKKLLSLFGSLTFVTAPVTTIIACGNPTSFLEELKDLSSIITETYLNPNQSFNTVPDIDMIQAAIVKLNPNLNTFGIQISMIADDDGTLTNEALVKANSTGIYTGSVIVFWTDPNYPKLTLSNVLKQTQLGQIQENEDLLSVTKSFNKYLEINEVQLNIDFEKAEEAMVGLKENQTTYSEDSEPIKITYNDGRIALRHLNQIITKPVLGYFETKPDQETILNRLSDLNHLLDINQIHLQELENNQDTLGQYKMQVVVNDDSKNYFINEKMEITFNYKISLTSIIDSTNLVEFSNNEIITNENIRQKLFEKKEFQDIVQSEVIISLNDKPNNPNTIIVQVVENSLVYYQDTIILNYAQKTNLSEVITTTYIGEFDGQPDAKTILTRLGEVNPNVDLRQIDIDLSTLTRNNVEVFVLPNSKDYLTTDRVILSYAIRISLRTIINPDEILHFEDIILTNDNLLQILSKKYPLLDIDEINAKLHETETNKIIITVKEDSTLYIQEELTLIYTDQSLTTLPLRYIIEETNLGYFGTKPETKEIVLERLKRVNPKLDLEQIDLDWNTLTENSITVIVKENATLYNPGEKIVLSYKITSYLSILLDDNKLWRFNDSNITDENVLSELKKQVPNLVTEEIIAFLDKTTNNEIIVRVKPNSKVYFQEEIHLIYIDQSFHPQISLKNIIKNTDLGYFAEKWSKEGENLDLKNAMIDKLAKLNSLLDPSQIEIGNIIKGKEINTFIAEISAKSDAPDYIKDDGGTTALGGITTYLEDVIDVEHLIARFVPDITITNDNLLTHLDNLFTNLNINGIEAEISNLPNQINIRTKPGNNIYFKTKLVLFYVDRAHPKIDFELLIKNAHLGELKPEDVLDPTSAFKKLKELNPLIERDSINLTLAPNRQIIVTINNFPSNIYNVTDKEFIFTYTLAQ